MTTTYWLPDEFLDECYPAPNTDRNAFIQIIDGKPYLSPIEVDPGAPDFMELRRPLNDGASVAFCMFRSFGTHPLTVHDDGTVDKPGGISSEATTFLLDGDPDTISQSLDELISGMDSVDALAPGTYTVTAYDWSAPIPHIFRAHECGGHFVESGS